MLLRGLFGGAGVVVMMGFANAPWQLLGLRVLEGILTGTVAAATALIATSAPKRRLGYALGMVQTAVFAGAAAGPLFGGLAYDSIGPRATFVLAGAMLFCGGVTVALLARERFARVATHAMTDEGQGRWRRFRTSGAFLFTGAMLTMLGAIFVVRLIAMAMQPIIPLFVQQLAPHDPHVATVAGIVLGSAGFTSAFAAAYLGRLGDRTGHRRVLAISLLGAGLVYLPMAVVRDPRQLALLQALMGVAAGGLIPSANALIAHLTPAGTARGHLRSDRGDLGRGRLHRAALRRVPSHGSRLPRHLHCIRDAAARGRRYSDLESGRCGVEWAKSRGVETKDGRLAAAERWAPTSVSSIRRSMATLADYALGRSTLQVPESSPLVSTTTSTATAKPIVAAIA